MRTEATTHEAQAARSEGRGALLLAPALGVLLAALVAMLAGTAREAHATFPGANGGIVFSSGRTTGTGVDNPTGDEEILTVNPDGTDLKQLTHNTVGDFFPVVSPDGTKVAYSSGGTQNSNSQGDQEVYRMNTLDGLGKKNVTNDGADDLFPDWGRQAM